MKQKRELVVLVVLLVTAGGVWLWFFWGGSPGTNTEVGAMNDSRQLLVVENPQIRFGEIEKARKAEYRSSGRNIFSVVAPAQVSRPKADNAQKISVNTPCGIPVGPCVPAPPPPPEPPKFPPNVKFFGYGSAANGKPRRAFLTDGDEVYIVNEGQLFLNRYRIIKIGNATLEFEELSTGGKGTAPLEEQPGGGPPQ